MDKHEKRKGGIYLVRVGIWPLVLIKIGSKDLLSSFVKIMSVSVKINYEILLVYEYLPLLIISRQLTSLFESTDISLSGASTKEP